MKKLSVTKRIRAAQGPLNGLRAAILDVVEGSRKGVIQHPLNEETLRDVWHSLARLNFQLAQALRELSIEKEEI